MENEMRMLSNSGNPGHRRQRMWRCSSPFQNFMTSGARIAGEYCWIASQWVHGVSSREEPAASHVRPTPRAPTRSTHRRYNMIFSILGNEGDRTVALSGAYVQLQTNLA
jgi:hypothetical protein